MSPLKTDRRQFLKTSGFLAAGTTLAAYSTPRVHAAEDNTIRIALVGCGGRGNGAIIDALNTKGPSKLVAMGDVFEDRVVNSRNALREHLGEDRIDVPDDRVFHGFDCYKKAIDCMKPGDLVILATACGFRPPHVEYAVEKGLNIFMEKPFAVDSPGTRRIAAAAKKADEKNLKLGCGLMWRHCKAREAVIDRIHNGEIGDVMHLRGFRMHGPIWAGHVRGKVDNEIAYQIRNFHYFDWAGANIFIDYCIHNIDVACWAKGAWPVRAMGMGGRTNFVPGTGYDAYYTEFEFADGTHLTSHGRYNAGCYEQYSDFAHGTKGSAVIMDNLGGANSRIYKNQVMTDANLTWKFGEPEPNPYQVEHDLLFDAIRNDKKYNEGHRAADANFASLLSRAAINSGQIVTWDQIVNSNVELVPGGIDNIDWNSPPPVVPDENGNYKFVIPGQGYPL